MKVKDHIHKLERRLLGGTKIERFIDPITGRSRRKLVRTGGVEIWKCVFPGCPTYYSREIALGKQSVCNTCLEILTLDSDNMKLKRPTHKSCRRTREMTA
jgi:hypothetical protein